MLSQARVQINQRGKDENQNGAEEGGLCHSVTIIWGLPLTARRPEFTLLP